MTEGWWTIRVERTVGAIVFLVVVAGGIKACHSIEAEHAEWEEFCTKAGGVKYEETASYRGVWICWRADGTRIFMPEGAR